MPEHLRLEQVLRQRRAVQRDEDLARPAALPMNELREHLLAGAALPDEHHRRIRRRDLAGQLDGRAKRPRRPEEGHAAAVAVRLDELLARAELLALQHHRMRGAAEHEMEVRSGKRLGQVVPRPRAQRFDVRCHAGVSRHHDDERLGVRLESGLEDLDAGHGRHVQIEHDDVEARPLHHLDGFVAATAARHGVAFDLQHARASFAQRAIVVHDEHANGRALRCRDECGVREWGTSCWRPERHGRVRQSTYCIGCGGEIGAEAATGRVHGVPGVGWGGKGPCSCSVARVGQCGWNPTASVGDTGHQV